MVLYFTGTGNSRYIARRIADRSKLRKSGHYRPFMMAAAIP